MESITMERSAKRCKATTVARNATQCDFKAERWQCTFVLRKQCQAMQSSAKQYRAMQSTA
eukprot:5449795-Pyramimonas_sp.AAC.1